MKSPHSYEQLDALKIQYAEASWQLALHESESEGFETEELVAHRADVAELLRKICAFFP